MISYTYFKKNYFFFNYFKKLLFIVSKKITNIFSIVVISIISGAIDLISGKNPLHFSCERGQEECATLLIETAHSRKDVYAKTACKKMGDGSGGGGTCFDLARSKILDLIS